MVLGTRQGLLLGSASRTQLVHPLRTPRAGRLIHAPGTALSSSRSGRPSLDRLPGPAQGEAQLHGRPSHRQQSGWRQGGPGEGAGGDPVKRNSNPA